MESTKFNSYSSLGDIKFNENREVVRKNNPDFKEFKKNKFSKNTSDLYSNFVIFYDKDNLVEAIEVSSLTDVNFKDNYINKLTINELSSLFNDPLMVEEEFDVNYPTLGVSVSFSEQKTESFLFYRKGYWV